MGRCTMLVCIALLAAVAIAGCAHSDAGTGASAPAATQTTLGNASRGSEVFRANCSACHTTDGTPGGVGPTLAHEKQRRNYSRTIAWIEQPDPPMPKLYPGQLSEKDVQDVATYVQSL